MISQPRDSSSDPVVNPGMNTMRGPNPSITLQRFLQDTSPYNVAPMTSQDSRFNVPSNHEMSALPLLQQVQGHQQLEDLSQMNPSNTGMPGIDQGMNSDLMSMWMNSAPGLL